LTAHVQGVHAGAQQDDATPVSTGKGDPAESTGCEGLELDGDCVRRPRHETERVGSEARAVRACHESRSLGRPRVAVPPALAEHRQ
jgi:hypothetical protein